MIALDADVDVAEGVGAVVVVDVVVRDVVVVDVEEVVDVGVVVDGVVEPWESCRCCC